MWVYKLAPHCSHITNSRQTVTATVHDYDVYKMANMLKIQHKETAETVHEDMGIACGQSKYPYFIMIIISHA